LGNGLRLRFEFLIRRWESGLYKTGWSPADCCCLPLGDTKIPLDRQSNNRFICRPYLSWASSGGLGRTCVEHSLQVVRDLLMVLTRNVPWSNMGQCTVGSSLALYPGIPKLILQTDWRWTLGPMMRDIGESHHVVFLVWTKELSKFLPRGYGPLSNELFVA